MCVTFNNEYSCLNNVQQDSEASCSDIQLTPADNTGQLEQDWEPALDPDPVHVWDVPHLLHLVVSKELRLTSYELGALSYSENAVLQAN